MGVDFLLFFFYGLALKYWHLLYAFLFSLITYFLHEQKPYKDLFFMLMGNAEWIRVRNVANLTFNSVILNFLLLSNVKNFVAFKESLMNPFYCTCHFLWVLVLRGIFEYQVISCCRLLNLNEIHECLIFGMVITAE